MSENPTKKVSKGGGMRLAPIITLSAVIILLAALLVITLLNLGSRELTIGLLAAGTLVAAVQMLLILRFFGSLSIIIKNAKLLSHGQLNISDIETDKTRGLEVLTVAFNDVKSNLLSFIEMTKGNVIVLSDAIDKVSKSIDMSYKGNEHIAMNINLVAEKAQDQLKLMKSTMESIEGIGTRVDTITSNIGHIEKSVEETASTTQEGNKDLDLFYSQLDTISTNLNSTYDFIEKLNLDIKEITEVSEFIIRISEQLKLLGINASVEASKAGEYSKGFTVVANEINNLSIKTKEGIVRIKGIVENIIKGSNIVNESIEGCVESFNTSKETFQSVKESFHAIYEQSTLLDNNMKDIYREINEINTSSKQTNSQTNTLYNSSNDICSKTQEIAAVTQEELAELEEINHNTTALNNMLSGIQHLISRFNTSITPVAKNSAKPLKLAFIAPMDHQFWFSVRQGVLYAKRELKSKNAQVELFGLVPFNQEDVIKTMDECEKNGYNGFVVPGFWDDMAQRYTDMANRGIAVMTFNNDINTKSKRLAYYGPSTYDQGVQAGTILAKGLEGKGTVLIAGRHGGMGIHEERQRGFEDALKGKKLKIVGRVEVQDTHDDVYREVKKYLSGNKDIDGVFVASGGPTGAAQAIEELGLTGRTKVVCFDHDKKIFEYIKKGIIYAAIGQDPFGQGHDPLVYLYNYLVDNVNPPADKIGTRADIVDIRNVNELLNA